MGCSQSGSLAGAAAVPLHRQLSRQSTAAPNRQFSRRPSKHVKRKAQRKTTKHDKGQRTKQRVGEAIGEEKRIPGTVQYTAQHNTVHSNEPAKRPHHHTARPLRQPCARSHRPSSATWKGVFLRIAQGTG